MIKVNNQEVIVRRFPNGEIKMPCIFSSSEYNYKLNIYNYTPDKSDIVISNDYDFIELTLKYESETDLIVLMFLKKYFDNSEFKDLTISLKLLYIPYSRMDRIHNEFEVFTLKYFCEFINNLHFNKVIVYEPHSDVSIALLDNVEKVDQTKLIFENLNIKDKDNTVICFPDAGAQKRYESLTKLGFKSVVGFKSRDWETGKITNLELLGTDVKNKNVYILDDLCSYGGTFMLTGAALKAKGAKEVNLVVTHAETNILKGDIFKNDTIDKVYCTNSIIDRCDISPDSKEGQDFIFNKLKIVNL